MEPLESRQLLAAFEVTSSADSGAGTLRQAILDANATPQADTVVFNLATTDPGYNPAGTAAPQAFWKISPTSALPTITAPLVIDGYTQAGASPNTVDSLDESNAVITVALVGTLAGPGANGLVFTADASAVRGLAVGGFDDTGVVVRANGCVVAGNYVGTDVSGRTAVPNANLGVLVEGELTGNAVGGVDPADRNLVSGNSGAGIALGFGATGTLVRNNFVGIGRTGFDLVGNGGDGVVLVDAPANTVRDNLIGGNKSSGVFVFGTGSSGNRIQGNLIGVDNFADDLSNLLDGIEVRGAPGNLIGGPGPGEGNLIGFNQGNGVSLRGPGATGNTLQNNVIGLTVDGSRPAANLLNGVFVQNASGNTIGGVNALNPDGSIATRVGNVISSNNAVGILLAYFPNASGSLAGGVPDDNVIQGNLIGTGLTGTELGMGNGQEGIRVSSGQNNVIGGTAPGAGNVISGNNTSGVLILGPTIPSVAEGLTRAASFNLIQGNFIGTDVTGRRQVRNLQQGVYIVDGVSNTVGGSAPGARNVISGNKGPGVQINGKFTTDDGRTFVATDNRVIGNYIGTDVTGSARPIDPDDPTVTTGNFGDGVLIDSGASGNFVGGTAPGEGNVISGNGQSGVSLARGASDNDVLGNLIGTDVTGLVGMGNSQDGVRVDNSPGNRVGGTVPGAGNVLSAGSVGVELTGAGTTGNLVTGNLIGTNAPGTLPLPNTAYGVLVLNGASDNTIGGAEEGARNVISGNGTGVAIIGPQSSRTFLQGNFIGTNATGTGRLGNRQTGVVVSNSSGNMIGGAAPGAGNVISGNSTSGVFLLGGSTGNLVQGNRIGTDAAGTSAVPNSGEGVLVTNAPGNLIGGGTPGAGNLVSGNGLAGVQIQGPDSVGNRVAGNLIGTDVSGKAALGNHRDGVLVSDAGRNVIGGSDPGHRNVISANEGNGVSIVGRGAGASGNVVAGNYVGLDVTGSGRLGNHVAGVALSASGNVVGGMAPGTGNVISANGTNGVFVTGADASGAVVVGNLVGTDASGLVARGNMGNGVLVSGAARATIGGAAAGAGNLISGNVLSGVALMAASGASILGNRIGTDATGARGLGNGDGVTIEASPGNVVGAPGAGNLIAANDGDGVVITGPASVSNTVQANRIGVDAGGSKPLGNLIGVHIVGAPGNLVGGPAAGARNVISGNTRAGVQVDGVRAVGNVVRGNLIGLDAAGKAVVKRAGAETSQPAGVLLTGTAGNLVGPGNVISGNDAGVVLAGFLRAEDLPGRALKGNVVTGNFIGTDLPRARGLGNSVGIYINGSARHQVLNNTISGASSTGVTVLGELSVGNVIQGNLIGGDDSGRRGLSNSTGVYLQDAPSNTLRDNTLAGNTVAGIYIFGSKATGNLIRSNRVRPAGSVRQQYGVLLYNAPNNPVPLSGADRNQIAGSVIANVREFTGPAPRTN